MKQWEKVPFGFSEASFNRRQQWMKDQGLDWESCSPELAGPLRGLIENHIGLVSVPLGLAGPCVVDGTYAKGTYYIPLATVEGTLVLSMSRGFSAAAQSGGIQTQHVQQILSRSPIFSFDNSAALTQFSQWITEQFPTLKEVAERNTTHGRLLRIEQYQIHQNLILDFIYTTAEAAGQNMTTFCTHSVCEYIKLTLGPQIPFFYLLESNFNCDKNPSTKVILTGRGHKAIATCTLSAEVCQSVLGISPQGLAEGMRLARYGSVMANTLGVNLHVANALTAIYLATGQDCACVSENAVGLFDAIYLSESNQLQCMLTLPSITVGTIGGGTVLPQQRANLKLIDCVGENSSKRLAELIAASALALEMSLGAAIMTNTFAQAHLLYGRKKKRQESHVQA